MNYYEKPTVGIYTLGCKVNQYESEAVAEELERQGFHVLPHTEVCGAYIINTCTVTAESDRKARQFIRRAIGKNPHAFIVVMGCFAQISPDSIALIDGVDVILGNSEKLGAVKKLSELFERGTKNISPEICVQDILKAGFENMHISHFDRTRAYVKIEDGCESKCTYCIIPYARGRIRSKKPSEVISEVEHLVNGGCREVVLTGIETASYGRDLGDVDLADILCRIDKINGIGRVRLGSLDPSLIKADFVKKISSLSCLAPHFHLSLQSGSNKVLALMKRKYNAETAMRAMEMLRENIPNVKFTTDIIVGFPNESEDDFEETARFVKNAEFLSVHIFPYSKRKGTPAASMSGQIPEEEKSRRLHRLEEISACTRQKILDDEVKKGDIHSVLFETFENGYAFGHTDDFIETAVKSDVSLHSQVKNVIFDSADGSVCFGHIV